MYILFCILILIASILLIGVVLIQKSKGGGLASNFASSNQIMGVRKTTDFVEKATWGLAIFICLASILTTFMIPSTKQNDIHVEAAQPKQEQSTPFETTTAQPAAAEKATPAAAEKAPEAQKTEAPAATPAN